MRAADELTVMKFKQLKLWDEYDVCYILTLYMNSKKAATRYKDLGAIQEKAEKLSVLKDRAKSSQSVARKSTFSQLNAFSKL